MKYIVFIIAILCFSVTLQAQQLPSEQQIYQRAAELGISKADIDGLNLDRDDVIRRIIAKGVNLEDQTAVENAALAIYQEELAKKKQAQTQEAQKDAQKDNSKENAENKATETIETTDKVTTEQNAAVSGETDEIAPDQDTEAKKEAATVDNITETLEELNVIEDNTGVYGQNIFSELSLYIDPKNMKPKSSYVVGAGDEFYITVYGGREGSVNLRVNDDGYVQQTGIISRTYIKGLNYEKARKIIIDRVSRTYNLNRANVEVGLSYARTVSIDIMGEVKKPGNYTLPGINSAFNALVASNGLNDIGSVRKIKLVRAGEATKVIDIYKYLSNPLEGENFYLQDNDIIIVPTLGRTVSVRGAVYKPNRFELINGENLSKLLEYAGGIKANAYKQVIRVTRVQNDKRELINVNLNDILSKRQDFKLEDGDIIDIKTIADYNRNYIELSGAFLYPDQYELSEGAKVSDYLEQAILKDEAKTDTAYIIRTNLDDSKTYIRFSVDNIISDVSSSDNIELQARDEIIVPAKPAYTSKFNVSINGEIRGGETERAYDESLTIRDLIYLAGGLKPSAADIAYLIRTLDDGSIEYQNVSLSAIMDGTNSLNNDLKLQPRDEIRVFDKKYFEETFEVGISGAVKNPGTFKYDKSLTLSDVLYFAGGLKREAANSRVEISRVNIKPNGEETEVIIATLSVNDNFEVDGGGDFILQPYDQIYVRTAADFDLQENVSIVGEINYQGTYSLTSLNGGESIYGLINRAGGLTEEAFARGATLTRGEKQLGAILLDLEDVLENPTTSPFNYKLRAGDVIEIPKAIGLVSIVGAIDNPIAEQTGGRLNVPFVKGKNASYYVKRFGDGVDRERDGRNRYITVTYANGDREETVDLGLFKIYPKVEQGAIVSVGVKPPKKEEDKKEKNEVDWNQVIDSTVTKVSAFATLFLLIQQGLSN